MILHWKTLHTEIYQNEKIEWIFACSMKTEVVGSSITSKTVSQDTTSGEMEESIWNKLYKIAKKVPRVPNKDKEQIDDKGIRKLNYFLENNKEREIEIEWTGKDLNQVREVNFDLIWTQEQKKITRTKHTAKIKTVWEDNKRLPKIKPLMLGKELRKQFTTKPSVEGWQVPFRWKPTKGSHWFWPGMMALWK